MLAGQDKNKKLGGLEARRRRSLRILIGIWGTGFLALVVGGTFALSEIVGSDAEAAITPAPGPVTATPQVAPVPADAPAPVAAALGAILAPTVADPALGTLTGSVTDTATGTVLWAQDPDRPMIPASTTKVLTAAAALLSLPPDHRVSTRVVEGSRPGEIVLVAGGDPTLTALPVGQDGFYPGAPRVADLVQQIQRSGAVVDTVLVDVGSYMGDPMATGWMPSDVGGGYIAPIEPVMLDGGRSIPNADESPRSPTPALDAGRALAAALGADPATVAVGTASPGAAPLASVQSAPLRDRLRQMMDHSDNVLAETIGREIAIASGSPASFSGAVDSVLRTLTAAGFDVGGVTMHDVSGLSVDNRIPTRLLDAVMASAAGTDQDALRPMLDYLPVAGATGTLSARYASANRDGAGWVRAKTGTLSEASGLVGTVVDVDGRVLSFALIANGRPPGESRSALDAVAATLRGCGCR
ncbi:D-alanyl-D-alanine carboxypeptidase/D-alanyl-D-alanine-endopeptidase [Rhodococcus sp. HM1]|uniref:D-alanyl-D-alanine carboxypeptidase/D-alanyl-D-alanine endopeptidase n=1 Tax=unclassified Rhodococcus (in: high G+C Gram-positive bacteria) TaxID=192944 RepID=UPI0018CEE947|nr:MULTISPECIES: D-alanyl-D-alanine carboxypeptidase/D-alanyl-D-alanine-endopeptidase [unclassified Rhodococcus (in: high G+C Gram-positive bacteria)]MBH0119391.1 D-alanyl-D-alanine carboxypeptidase/D-alanyl-D-alanine-endopeptidase [Rhodococcus sp. CX]MCK8674233.1 D-alanyl-D-alanine carboxypeptidase/D-alanyl-D-alanine-endopeptidase [Rhodococcus sp. HM1]